MIGVHAAGLLHDYKKMRKVPGRCYTCGVTSECRITRFQKAWHIFYIKFKVLEEQYIFDWKRCGHRAVLYDPKDVARYKAEQVQTGIFAMPYYHDMKLRQTFVPKPPSAWKVILIIAISMIAGILLVILFKKLGIPYIF